MIKCYECGKESRGKIPKWAKEQNLVWYCKICEELIWEIKA